MFRFEVLAIALTITLVSFRDAQGISYSKTHQIGPYYINYIEESDIPDLLNLTRKLSNGKINLQYVERGIEMGNTNTGKEEIVFIGSNSVPEICMIALSRQRKGQHFTLNRDPNGCIGVGGKERKSAKLH